MLEQLYRILFAFATRFKISAKAALRICERAAESVGSSPYSQAEARQYEMLLQISEILGTWYREPEFLNDKAKPRPLAIFGASSFETLATRFMPQFAAADIVRILIEEHLLIQRANGELLPVRRTAAFAKANRMMLDRVPVLSHAMLGTLAHNAQPRSRKKGTYCERGTTIDRFPVAAIPAFNAFVKEMAQALIDEVDEWAAPRQHSDPTSVQHNVARVGVEVFTYVERPQQPRRGGKRR